MRTPANAAQRMGFRNVDDLGQVFNVARHLRAGGTIGQGELLALQAVYPNVPPEVLVLRAQQINAAPKADRMDRFVTEIGGPGAVAQAQQLLADYDHHYERESTIDAIDARLDARPRDGTSANGAPKDDPLSVRSILEAQTHQKPPSTYQGARNLVAGRMEHVAKVLHAPDPEGQVSLRDTIAAAVERPLVDSLAEELMTDADLEGAEESLRDQGLG